MLLDEPFSALDAALRVETRLAVAASLEAAGATAVLVTHDQAEALSLGQQVGVLRRGVLVQMDRPETLYAQPRRTWNSPGSWGRRWCCAATPVAIGWSAASARCR